MRTDLTIAGRRLHYQDHGHGPAVLLGHSYLWDHRMWEPQVTALIAAGFRCVVPDLWAHGASDPAPDTDLNALAEHHHALMRHLGLDRYAIVGLSGGGMWGLRLALRHPEAVTALVVADASAMAEPEASRQRYLAMLTAVNNAPVFPPAIRAAIVPGFFSPRTRRERPALVAAFDASLAAWPAAGLPHLAAIGQSIFSRPDLSAEVSHIRAPTLVLVGEDDLYRPVPEARALSAAIPGARLETIAGAGHIANLEQPEVFTRLLCKHLLQAANEG